MAEEAVFSPPSAVVGPAFQELRARHARALLARARPGSLESPSGRSALLSSDELAAVGYGADARAGVVRRALTLVFVQWAVHRAGVRHVRARLPRVLYGCACAASTLAYVERGAKRVAHETFERIIALPTTSPLANEARVILAELEGPAGPYFSEKAAPAGGEEAVAAAVAAQDAVSPPKEGEALVHAQLRIRPRLLEGTNSMRVRAGRQRAGRGLPETVDMPELAGDEPFVVRREMRKQDFESGGQMRQGAHSLRQQREKNKEGDSGPESVSAPFDFAKAARGATDEDAISRGNLGGDGDELNEKLTPSQRRARARRERRRRARERGLTPEELGQERLW